MSGRGMVASVLLETGLVDAAGLARAVELQGRHGGSLGHALASLGLADEETVCAAIAGRLRLDYVTIDAVAVDQHAMDELPLGFCRERLVVPLSSEQTTVRLAMADPVDYRSIQDVEFRTGKRVVGVAASETTVRILISRLSGDGEQPLYEILAGVTPEGVAEPARMESDADEGEHGGMRPPIIRLVNMILSDAAKVGASDVHVEPHESHLQVRRRIDGLLEDVLRIPRQYHGAVVSRLKLIAGMDIAERRRPQDGRSALRIGGARVDLRLSSLPTQFGEKIVIRLLDNRRAQLDLEVLGLSGDVLTAFLGLLARPQGMILVTGPTGSGKTSTLYAALKRLRSPVKNIITVEDPVEYQLPGVNQVPINVKAGMTFASGLRSILRQDPNIVLVGEIRDRETANIALEAAQTGHLVLSTVHTNDAPSTITRLVDLGVEPFLIASALVGVVAQRLVRRPCPACATDEAPTADELRGIGGAGRVPSDATWKVGRGCDACGGSGYKGRVAVHELMVVNDEIRELISRRASDDELREAAQRSGMRTLTEEGIAKAARGLTTLAEVLRVVPPDSAAVAASIAAAPSLPVARVASAPAETTAPRTGGRTVVVEDSPTVAAVVRYYLELEGFEVFVAADGNEGLLLAKRERPDVVVTDLNMPGMDGITMVQALRANPDTEHVAVVMLTAESSIDTEAQAFAAGADAYLLKPVEPRRLAAHVRAVLKRAARAIPGAA